MAISVASLTTGSNSTTTSTYNTTSIAPGADKVLIVAVTSTRSDGAEMTSVSGLGLTWSRVDGGPVGSSPTRTASIWRAVTGGSAPTPGTLTLTYNSSPSALCWSVLEVSGADTTAPIVQSKVATALAGTSVTATFDTTPAAGNGIVAGTGLGLQTTLEPGTGYTEPHAEVTIGGPNGTLQTQWRADGVATSSASWASASDAVMVAVEVKAAGGGGEDPGEGTASGTFTFTSSATGARTPKGAGTGSWSFTGTAAGVSTRTGTATGSLAWAGAATGTAPSVDGAEGTATGTWSYTGTAAGVKNPAGTGAGTWTYTGAATGDAPSVDGAEGTATGSWAYVGTAAGARASQGATSGVLAWVGAAAGTRTASGTATGLLTWVGTALGGDLRDVTVLSITEHQRQVAVTEHARAVAITEHQRAVTIEGDPMQLDRAAREFYTLEIVTDPAVTSWEAHFGEVDEAGDEVWVAGTVDGANTRWLLAGPDAELDAAVAVIETNVEPKIRAIDNPEIIVRTAPAVYLT